MSQDKLGVWGLGFGVWGLGFGVWGICFTQTAVAVHRVAKVCWEVLMMWRQGGIYIIRHLPAVCKAHGSSRQQYSS